MNVSGYRVIIGDNVPVFDPAAEIQYQAVIPFQFTNKNVCLQSSDPIITGASNQICTTITMSAPSASVHLFYGSDIQTFHGSTDAFQGVYQDTTTGNNPSFYAKLGNYVEPILVRVARPAVGNTSGGSVYFGQASGYDVNAIVSGFLDDLSTGNFTTQTLRSGDLGDGRNISSSSQSAVIGSNTQASIQSGSLADESSLNRFSTGVTLSPGTTTIQDISQFSSLPMIGDTSGARTLASGDLAITAPLTLAGQQTIVVEHGNLIISANILNSADSSWAFIVKNGNIVIASNVTDIAGVFVVMGSSGAIQSDGSRTTTQLKVDGTLYGNTSDLVNHRTYIRGEEGYQALSIGVIIDYSTRAVKSPPPLLRNFLDQFSLDKVAN